MTLNSSHLQAIGTALYGRYWHAPLADALGVAERSVRRWAAGRPVPAGVWEELREICVERDKTLSGIVAWLEHETAKGDLP